MRGQAHINRRLPKHKGWYEVEKLVYLRGKMETTLIQEFLSFSTFLFDTRELSQYCFDDALVGVTAGWWLRVGKKGTLVRFIHLTSLEGLPEVNLFQTWDFVAPEGARTLLVHERVLRDLMTIKMRLSPWAYVSYGPF